MAPRQLMRRGEKIYKEQGLNDDSLSDKKLVAAMVADPILIERPIILANGKAAAAPGIRHRHSLGVKTAER